MQTEFSLGYILMVDGEKDPRNLLTIFGLTPTVILNFPIGVLPSYIITHYSLVIHRQFILLLAKYFCYTKGAKLSDIRLHLAKVQYGLC